MSVIAIRAAIETALSLISPLIDTVYENTDFKPVIGQKYQSVSIVMGRPENPVLGGTFKREVGVMMILLYYPLLNGTKNSLSRAELISSVFKRGATFSSGGVDVVISGTPEVDSNGQDGKFWITKISVPFFANIN
jgi:hypothetical protein